LRTQFEKRLARVLSNYSALCAQQRAPQAPPAAKQLMIPGQLTTPLPTPRFRLFARLATSLSLTVPCFGRMHVALVRTPQIRSSISRCTCWVS